MLGTPLAEGREKRRVSDGMVLRCPPKDEPIPDLLASPLSREMIS